MLHHVRWLCEPHLYVWTALCCSSGRSQTMRWSGTKLKKHHRSYYSISLQYELNKKCTHSHFSLQFTSSLLKTNVWKLWKHDCECERYPFCAQHLYRWCHKHSRHVHIAKVSNRSQANTPPPPPASSLLIKINKQAASRGAQIWIEAKHGLFPPLSTDKIILKSNVSMQKKIYLCTFLT